MLLRVIANTDTSREEFSDAACKVGGGFAESHIVLDANQVAALQGGKCIAFDNGEYTFFLTMANSSSPDSKEN